MSAICKICNLDNMQHNMQNNMQAIHGDPAGSGKRAENRENLRGFIYCIGLGADSDTGRDLSNKNNYRFWPYYLEYRHCIITVVLDSLLRYLRQTRYCRNAMIA